MHEPISSAPRARWRTLLPVALPVLLAHAPFLGVTASFAETPAPVHASAVAVRVIDAPAPVETVAPPAVAPAKPKRPALQPVADLHKNTTPTATDAPVYSTRLPPSRVMRYEISRGAWRGDGEMTWELQDKRYHLRLEGRVMGIRAITQDSSGQIDNAGIAPVRFTDERRGKSAMAANFQRAAGKITYSGPSNEYTLVPGTQDRLSWMVQIAAIAAADPSRVATGKRIGMFVTGARGDADVWTFRSIGVENMQIGGVPVAAVKLAREPRKEHDSEVEVWLDPRDHHLPVRARMTNDGESFELLRRAGDPS